MNQVICITGGSEGLGFGLAQLFAQNGDTIILIARNQEKLDHAKKQLEEDYHSNVFTIACDLSQLDGAKKIYDEIMQITDHIDIFINNAGLGYVARSEDVPFEKDEEMMIVNNVSLVQLSKYVIKDMRKCNRGEIINICSTSALQPGPYMNTYYATKAFVYRYSEALAFELKDTNIKIYCYMVGPIDTDFYHKANSKKTIGAISVKKAASYLYTHRKNKVMIMRIQDRIMQWLPKYVKMKFIANNKRKNLQ